MSKPIKPPTSGYDSAALVYIGDCLLYLADALATPKSKSKEKV